MVYKNKASEKAAKWAKAHPEFARARQTKRRRLLKAKLQELKNVPCLDCGGTFPPICMDFDHRDPSTKKYPGMNMLASFHNHGEAMLQEEIAKCDIVCANCHRIRTEKRRHA